MSYPNSSKQEDRGDVHGKSLGSLLVVLEAQQVCFGEHQVLLLLAEHGAARLDFAMQQGLTSVGEVAEVGPVVGQGAGARDGREEGVFVGIRQAHALERAKDGTRALAGATQSGLAQRGALCRRRHMEIVMFGQGRGLRRKAGPEGGGPLPPQQVCGLVIVFGGVGSGGERADAEEAAAFAGHGAAQGKLRSSCHGRLGIELGKQAREVGEGRGGEVDLGPISQTRAVLSEAVSAHSQAGGSRWLYRARERACSRVRCSGWCGGVYRRTMKGNKSKYKVLLLRYMGVNRTSPQVPPCVARRDKVASPAARPSGWPDSY